MDATRANVRKKSGGDKSKNASASSTRGRSDRGARGGRAISRGRGRGRGRSAGRTPRVVMAWNSDSEADDASADDTDDEGTGEVELTESDYERLEEEIDGVVGFAELEVFAGTMIVDADDVELQREQIAAATAKGQQTKKEVKAKKKKKTNEKEKTHEAQESVEIKAKAKKPKKKERVSVVITDDAVLEIVPLENEVGVTDSGQTIAITVKETKVKKKKKNKATGKETEGVYASMQVHEVAELVETTVADATTTKQKKKKEKKKSADAADRPPAPPSNKSKIKSPPKEETVVTAGQAKKKKEKKGKKAEAGESTEVANKDKVLKKDKSKASSTEASTSDKPKTLEATLPKPRDNFYENYSDRTEVLDAIERGALYQGKIRINPQYRLRAFITVDGIPVDILIDGTKDRNRAMDGDLVAIQLYDEDQWKPLKDSTKADRNSDKNLVVEKHGPLPTTDADHQLAAERKVALNALWRPTLESSRCFLPQQTTGNTKASTMETPIHSVSSVAERSAAAMRRPTGKVVFILAAGNAEGFVGALEPKTKRTDRNAPLSAQDDYAYFNADDLRLPRRIRIPRLQLPDEFVTRPLEYSQHMLCFCRISKWSPSHESPMGEFVKTLGEYSGIESGISAILLKHGLMPHTVDFRQDILDELDDKYGTGGDKWTIPESELGTRRDFRSHQIFSIDPYNARDLDDALHIRALNPEATLFEVGVHIADVTHFIESQSALDCEAQQRATSVYLANRVLPMLPRMLCERLCSLQPQVDRLAFSVVWQMHSDGSLVEDCVPWFGKSIIRSCCKLDYGTAQRMLDGTVTADALDAWEPERQPIEGDNPAVTPASVIQGVQYLWTVAKHRRATRFDTGAVTLQDIKLTFTLDAMGNPLGYGTYEIKDSNRLVEEYMLLANYLVAQKLLQAQGPLAFLRRHPEPNETALETTLSILSDNTIAIDGSTPKHLSDSLDLVRQTKGDYVYGVVQNMITKPMKPAEYLVAGTAGFEDAWRHYALNIPYYTHFTSPIRRYADVVVHRLLQESLIDPAAVATRIDTRGDELTQRMTKLQSVADNCNEKKMTAKSAEKECDQVFLCAFVKHHGTVDVTGVIVSTGPRSFTVYISEMGIEQRIEVRDLGSVRWSWQEKTATLALEFGSTKKARRSKSKKKSNEDKESDAVVEREDEGNAEGETVGEVKGAKPAVVERVELHFLTKLRMRMTTTASMPLALKFDVVGPWKE